MVSRLTMSREELLAVMNANPDGVNQYSKMGAHLQLGSIHKVIEGRKGYNVIFTPHGRVKAGPFKDEEAAHEKAHALETAYRGDVDKHVEIRGVQNAAKPFPSGEDDDGTDADEPEAGADAGPEAEDDDEDADAEGDEDEEDEGETEDDVDAGEDGEAAALTPEQAEQEGKRLLADMHAGFSQLLAADVHDLSGTEGGDEDEPGEEDEGEDDEDAGDDPEEAEDDEDAEEPEEDEDEEEDLP